MSVPGPHGRPDAGAGDERELERFWSKVRKDPDGCWRWTGYVGWSGYGVFYARSGRWGSHRYAYGLAKGRVPEGLQLDHLCRVRSCVNPDHLEAVTNRVNALRGVGPTARHAAQTHCKRGHPLPTEPNVISASGHGVQRLCLECQRMRRQPKGGEGGSPPVHSRFKPGQSGNPKGRPRKKRPLELARKALRLLQERQCCGECRALVDQVGAALDGIASPGGHQS